MNCYLVSCNNFNCVLTLPLFSFKFCETVCFIHHFVGSGLQVVTFLQKARRSKVAGPHWSRTRGNIQRIDMSRKLQSSFLINFCNCLSRCTSFERVQIKGNVFLLIVLWSFGCAILSVGLKKSVTFHMKWLVPIVVNMLPIWKKLIISKHFLYIIWKQQI